MSFDPTKLQQNSSFSMVNNGFPGLFTYISATDNLAAIIANGYFPSNQMTGRVLAGDFLQIAGTDGSLLKVFNSSFHVLDPVQFPSNSIQISTITANSGNLSVETFYTFNITGIGNYTLPDASGNAGKRIYFKQISALGACNINTSGGQNVISLSALNNRGTVISDGTNWFDIG